MEKKAAESTFLAFVWEIQRQGPDGFLYATADKKVYSFESWLRQKNQHPPEVVQAFCEHVKSTNYIKKAGRDFRRNNAKVFFKSVLWMMLVGLFLYPIAGALLWLFDVSIWNFTVLLSFVIGGGVLMALGWARSYVKTRNRYEKEKAGQPASSNMVTLYIKIFDSDTFDFIAEAKKLFKG